MRRPGSFAWLTLAFNVAVIILGALVRATGSGAGCGRNWPSCQGEFVPALEGATAIEYLHRVTSGLALIMVVSLFILVRRRVDRGEPARLGATLALFAIIGEALIGAMLVLAEWVADDTSPARTVAVPLHLVNTLFLLASLALTAFWLSGGGRLHWSTDRALRRWVLVGGVALVLIAGTGAVTALADTLFPHEPFVSDFTAESHFLARLRIIHPILAVVAASIGWWASSRAGSPRSRSGRALPYLVAVMIVSGGMNVLLGVPLALQLLHLLLADTLWIAYVLASAHALAAAQPVSQPVY